MDYVVAMNCLMKWVRIFCLASIFTLTIVEPSCDMGQLKELRIKSFVMSARGNAQV